MSKTSEDAHDELISRIRDKSSPLTLKERRAFLKLPMEMRRILLREQADRMADYYERDTEWREIEGGDFVEEESS